MGGIVKGIFGGGGYKETNADRKQAAAVDAQSRMAQELYKNYTLPELARSQEARASLAPARSGLLGYLGNPLSSTALGGVLASPDPATAGANFGNVMRMAGGLNRQNQVANASLGVMGNAAMRGLGNSSNLVNQNNALQNMQALQRVGLEAQLLPQQQALEAALRQEQAGNFWNALNYLTQDAQLTVNPYGAVGTQGDIASQYGQMAALQQQRQQAAQQQQAQLWNTLGMLAGNFLVPGLGAAGAAANGMGVANAATPLTGWLSPTIGIAGRLGR